MTRQNGDFGVIVSTRKRPEGARALSGLFPFFGHLFASGAENASSRCRSEGLDTVHQGQCGLGAPGVAVAAWNRSRVGLYAAIPVCVTGFAALTPSLQSLLSRLSDPTEQGGHPRNRPGNGGPGADPRPVAGIVLFERGVTYPYWCGAAIMALGALLISRLRGGPALD